MMLPEGHKAWISLPQEGRKLILDQDSPSTSALTESLGSARGWGGVGRGRGSLPWMRSESLTANYLLTKAQPPQRQWALWMQTTLML